MGRTFFLKARLRESNVFEALSSCSVPLIYISVSMVTVVPAVRSFISVYYCSYVL